MMPCNLQINQAVKTQRSTYLSDPEWMELPWKGRVKTPIDQLVDISAGLARILVQGFEIQDLESIVIFHAAMGLIGRCREMELKLRDFYADFDKGNRGRLYWSKFTTADNSADDVKLGKVFPVAFHFPNIRVAHTCMIYWTTMILLWATLSHLYRVLATTELPNEVLHGLADNCSQNFADAESSNAACGEDVQLYSNQPDFNQLLPLEPRLDVVTAMRNICQSIEYCMQDEMKSIGPQATVIPLMAVIDTLPALPHHGRELAWARAAFEKVKEKGFHLLRYLDKEE